MTWPELCALLLSSVLPDTHYRAATQTHCATVCELTTHIQTRSGSSFSDIKSIKHFTACVEPPASWGLDDKNYKSFETILRKSLNTKHYSKVFTRVRAYKLAKAFTHFTDRQNTPICYRLTQLHR